MIVCIPVTGFIELLTSRELFCLTAKYSFYRAALLHGMVPEIDEKALEKVHSDWREAVLRWDGKENQLGDLSHIKMSGLLLWAFNEQD